jgi:hypothetical protein
MLPSDKPSAAVVAYRQGLCAMVYFSKRIEHHCAKVAPLMEEQCMKTVLLISQVAPA